MKEYVFKLRPAVQADAEQLGHVHHMALKKSLPFLPNLHTLEEDIAYFSKKVLKEEIVWVAEMGDKIVGLCAFTDGWINQLYILPEMQAKGVGSKLISVPMTRFSHLQLWTFQKSLVARKFYESKGFQAIEKTDGQGNDEKEPDVHYEWHKP